MKIENLTGYMLGNGKNPVIPGEPWRSFDTNVYICRTLDDAKARKQSEIRLFANGDARPLWTTIYRVRAREIECDRISDTCYWTRQATKIFVDGPVLYCDKIQFPTAEALRARAFIVRQAMTHQPIERTR